MHATVEPYYLLEEFSRSWNLYRHLECQAGHTKSSVSLKVACKPCLRISFNGTWKDHAQSGRILAALGMLGCRCLHAPSPQCTVRYPGCPQDVNGWVRAWTAPYGKSSKKAGVDGHLVGGL